MYGAIAPQRRQQQKHQQQHQGCVQVKKRHAVKKRCFIGKPCLQSGKCWLFYNKVYENCQGGKQPLRDLYRKVVAK